MHVNLIVVLGVKSENHKSLYKSSSGIHEHLFESWWQSIQSFQFQDTSVWFSSVCPTNLHFHLKRKAATVQVDSSIHIHIEWTRHSFIARHFNDAWRFFRCSEFFPSCNRLRSHLRIRKISEKYSTGLESFTSECLEFLRSVMSGKPASKRSDCNLDFLLSHPSLSESCHWLISSAPSFHVWIPLEHWIEFWMNHTQS